MFCRSVAKQIAGMIVALDGVDALVFTGGIGEHDAGVRGAICRQLGSIGVRLDEDRNQSAADRIDDATSRCRVQVLPSQEDEQIARHAGDIVASSRSRLEL
jgi:acetate kinase